MRFKILLEAFSVASLQIDALIIFSHPRADCSSLLKLAAVDCPLVECFGCFNDGVVCLLTNNYGCSHVLERRNWGEMQRWLNNLTYLPSPPSFNVHVFVRTRPLWSRFRTNDYWHVIEYRCHLLVSYEPLQHSRFDLRQAASFRSHTQLGDQLCTK